ncbi:MAG: hypothetical protein R3281_09690 [Balneolaceae bacterium]|nr:hypothetical protein [Balneolaceae bacterium]
MPNDNNASIRYLMKEMDPSEEVLMERSMMEDEDLLIEVECMRQTLKKLDEGLPRMDPPDSVREEILQKAANHTSQGGTRAISVLQQGNTMGYIAAAAVVAVGFISGILLYQEPPAENSANGTGQTTQSASAAAPAPSTVDFEGSKQEVTAETVPVNSVRPWVDNKEILRFQDQFSSENQAQFDSMLNTSMQKLKPINDPLYLNPDSPSLQLTGSEQ